MSYRQYQRKVQDDENPDGDVRVGMIESLTRTIDECKELLDKKGRVTVSGLGNAISRVVTVGEILKRRVPNLHQWLNL